MEEENLITITVDVISKILLGAFLLPKLRETAERFGTLPHLVIITSRVSFDFDRD